MEELRKISQTYLGFDQKSQMHKDREYYENDAGTIFFRTVSWRRQENGLERDEKRFFVYGGSMSKEEIRDSPSLAIDYERYAKRLRDWSSEGRD